MTTDSFKPVALISMPSLSARFPSFQLALLKPTLEREGIPVQTFSLFMYFGTHVGWRINETLSDVYPCMLGEWIWTRAAFGDFADNDEYFKIYRNNLEGICQRAGCTLDDLRRLRETAAPAFIDFCMNSVDWSRFSVIGFSVVFQQTLASIALARALKQRYPHIPIMMGGATFEDDIAEEIMKGCPEVDYVHCGDADETLPKAIRRLQNGESMSGMPGMMWRDNGRIAYAGRAPNLADMNKTPTPDFDEYFYARKEGGYHYSDQAQGVLLPIETARGCWWGVKNHCTFCGLNRAGMEFRSKRVDNVIQQLDQLSRRYGILDFNAIDNIIAPEYIDELFNQLSAANTDIRMHYEVRPSLSRVQLKQMRKGGLFSIQPGVESLSTHILKLMRKHTTGVRNLELIKWSTYYGINNLYNILLRFPGETLDDYRAQCEVMAKIHHFQAPWAIAKARADRGSPMYTEPESQSVTRLVPSPCYDFLFPKDRFDLNRVSYYFEHEMGNTLADDEYNEIFAAVDVWQQRWKQRPRPYLRYRKAWATILIEDGRNCSTKVSNYSDRYANLYEFCADARSRKEISAKFDDAPWLDTALEEFVAKDLMVHLDNRYLSLALPENPYY
ncbi:MAG TPA: RiPP maturation radical SAM C-methyltransferase [Pyrinomonadaceae bacterium]|jgi:ribosomal peptide maturation radical SAM protein 1|nr:RiPP maturation radical SAM C-methyltransferase [Pyrinomonadaceae bacterium]